MIAATTGLSSFALVSALWGFGSSILAEVVKQDGLPKWVNTIIANVMLVVAAAFATLTDATWSWHNFFSALVVAATAAMMNHQLILKPTGIGDALSAATSVIKPAAADPVAVVDPPEPVPVDVPPAV